MNWYGGLSCNPGMQEEEVQGQPGLTKTDHASKQQTKQTNQTNKKTLNFISVFSFSRGQ